MSKISGWNFSQNITSADNCKQKNEDLDTWYVGMNDFARIAGGQNSRSNILSPRAFLEFLAKIFTLGYVDFSKRSNEAGRNMMAHIKSSSYIKNNDGSEIMKFVMNNPEGERADLSKVEIEITLASAFNNGIREGHTVIIFTQPDGSTNRYEGKSFERKDESSLHLITKEVAIKWSAAPDMTPQTVLYRRPVAQFSNFQPKIVSSWLILALFQANFLISGRSRLCPYQLVNSNQVRQGE